MAGNLLHSPDFVESRTSKGLVSEMLKNNNNRGREFRYFDIQKEGKWIAWYYRDFSDDFLGSLNRDLTKPIKETSEA